MRPSDHLSSDLRLKASTMLLAQNYAMAYALVSLFLGLGVLGLSLPRFRKRQVKTDA